MACDGDQSLPKWLTKTAFEHQIELIVEELR